ncbi:MAG: hypothetical protein AUJ49_04960 [Desulfovibrionaceae bacterium CG1_02_65_16]|nr:MAG: hypothetical protein AUJ49_04960 [Desulfovibrionaceae bacterium CG1_02_65_16]
MDTKLLLKSKTILGILITILGGALGQTDLTALLQLLHTGSMAQTIASGLLMAVGGGLTMYGRATVPGAALRIGSLILRRILEPDVIKEISEVSMPLTDEKINPKPGDPFTVTSYPSPLHAVAAAMEAGQIPKDQNFLDLYFPSAPLASAPAQQPDPSTPSGGITSGVIG